MTNATSWLLLLYSFSARHSTGRVNLWRKLKKFGALPFKTSACVLPDQPVHYERLQWLAEQIRTDGGEATLIRVAAIEGMPAEKIAQMFNTARAKDYEQLASALKKAIRRTSSATELPKLERRFQEIRELDYFDCPSAHDTLLLLQRARKSSTPKTKPLPRANPKDFAGRTWLTRPRPEIDRVGSAWLIRKFIDPQARFVFSAHPGQHPKAIPYDMPDVEFTHHGDDCTFETLIKRFGITDATARNIAAMIHDADLEDDKFHRPECIGIDRILKGWAKEGRSDDEILRRGFECFDALYECLRK